MINCLFPNRLPPKPNWFFSLENYNTFHPLFILFNVTFKGGKNKSSMIKRIKTSRPSPIFYTKRTAFSLVSQSKPNCAAYFLIDTLVDICLGPFHYIAMNEGSL